MLFLVLLPHLADLGLGLTLVQGTELVVGIDVVLLFRILGFDLVLILLELLFPLLLRR